MYIYIYIYTNILYYIILHYIIYMYYMGQFSRSKNLADWDEGLFTRMGYFLFLSKVVLILSEEKNDRGYVKYMLYS